MCVVGYCLVTVSALKRHWFFPRFATNIKCCNNPWYQMDFQLKLDILNRSMNKPFDLSTMTSWLQSCDRARRWTLRCIVLRGSARTMPNSHLWVSTKTDLQISASPYLVMLTTSVNFGTNTWWIWHSSCDLKQQVEFSSAERAWVEIGE